MDEKEILEGKREIDKETKSSKREMEIARQRKRGLYRGYEGRCQTKRLTCNLRQKDPKTILDSSTVKKNSSCGLGDETREEEGAREGDRDTARGRERRER